MKRGIMTGIILILVLCLCAGCTPYSELVPKTPRDVLDVAMYVLTGGESAQPLLLGTNGKPVAMSAPTGLAKLIAEKVSYEVVSITEEGDSATAMLNITAPDAVPLVYQALEGMESFDEEAFTEAMQAQLEDDPATVNYNVQVQLQRVDGTWCMVSNAEFSNAITGGLMNKYNEVQQAIYDAFVKGGA